MARRVLPPWVVGALGLSFLGGIDRARQAPEGLTIHHERLTCAVAEKHPRIEARLNPASLVRVAQVHFRAKGGAHWYSVAMERSPEADVFYGVLPRPRRTLAGFDYYIEVLSEGLQPTRTREYSPVVVTGPGACADAKAAMVAASASVRLVTPPGAPPFPVGFSPAGVTAAAAGGSAAAGATAGATGGGLSTTTVAILAGSGAAAATAVVVVASGDETLEGGFFEGTGSPLVGVWRASGCTFDVTIPLPRVTMRIGQGADAATFSFSEAPMIARAGLDAAGKPCEDAKAGAGSATIPLTVSGASIWGSGPTASANSFIEVQATQSRDRIAGSYTWRPNPERALAGSDPASGTLSLTRTP